MKIVTQRLLSEGKDTEETTTNNECSKYNKFSENNTPNNNNNNIFIKSCLKENLFKQAEVEVTLNNQIDYLNNELNNFKSQIEYKSTFPYNNIILLFLIIY